MKTIYITGIGGLVGSAVAEHALGRGYHVRGTESDARGRWFGLGGSVAWRVLELEAQGVEVLRRDFRTNLEEVKGASVVVHCASQPSHDLSREQPVDDSALNFMGTVELLEATRKYASDAAFVFLSTNKVYGDRINHLRYRRVGDRYEPEAGEKGVTPWFGINEEMSLDASLHTPFGASKAAADLMVQEYRHCYGLKTVSLRCGCLTGPTGSAVELHGFLGYLVKCATSGLPYTVYGYDGLQVRDNLAADDLAEAILGYAEDPKGGVYNMGGGRSNSISILEAVKYLRKRGFHFETKDGPERLGDHRWYITDLRKFQADYPAWRPATNVYRTMDAIAERIAA